jgi:hypothetical protein
VQDGDLAGRGRVEPGDGLVRPDLARALAPQPFDGPVAELGAADGAGGGDGEAVFGDIVRRVESGVGQGHGGGGDGEMGHAVGLHDAELAQMVGGGEAVDLAGQAQREAVGVEAADGADAGPSGERRLPVGLRAEAVGGDDADAGDHGAGGAHLVSTIAHWKPPKPLATVSTVSVRCSRAVSGT